MGGGGGGGTGGRGGAWRAEALFQTGAIPTPYIKKTSEEHANNTEQQNICFCMFLLCFLCFFYVFVFLMKHNLSIHIVHYKYS